MTIVRKPVKEEKLRKEKTTKQEFEKVKCEKEELKKEKLKKEGQNIKKPGKKKRISVSNIILTLMLFAGLSVMLYPTVSDWWNSRHASQAIANYVEAVTGMDPEVKNEMLEAARQYNASLSMGVHFKLTDQEYGEYESLLDLTGTGIMGYIQIPSINVNLPVYHGTEESVLQVAVGHIAGSSLPVGGDGSHCVVSGHRGLPTARLFTDLDDLGEGDIFMLNVLEETVTYEIDQIRLVLPEEVDDLAIVAGKDYCTMVTCTPYGINTHRMLVRGHRVDNVDVSVVVVPADAVRIPNYYVIPAVGIPLLFITLVVMLAFSGRKKPGRTQQEMLDALKKQKPEE